MQKAGQHFKKYLKEMLISVTLPPGLLVTLMVVMPMNTFPLSLMKVCATNVN